MFSDKFRQAYLSEVGISRRDKPALLHAYETAYRIREFEIDLYWRRTAYIWAMQAALIGIAAILRTLGDTTIRLDTSAGWSNVELSSTTTANTQVLVAVVLISLLAFVIACLWSALIEGAKFWQDNWERHVDILGHELGQNLYQVYPVKNRLKMPPFSVTKLNKYIVFAFVFFWIANLLWALWDLADIYSATSAFGLTCVFAAFLFFLGLIYFFCLCQFRNSIAYNGLRMAGYGKQVDGLPKGKNDPRLFQRFKP